MAEQRNARVPSGAAYERLKAVRRIIFDSDEEVGPTPLPASSLQRAASVTCPLHCPTTPTIQLLRVILTPLRVSQLPAVTAPVPVTTQSDLITSTNRSDSDESPFDPTFKNRKRRRLSTPDFTSSPQTANPSDNEPDHKETHPTGRAITPLTSLESSLGRLAGQPREPLETSLFSSERPPTVAATRRASSLPGPSHDGAQVRPSVIRQNPNYRPRTGISTESKGIPRSPSHRSSEGRDSRRSGLTHDGAQACLSGSTSSPRHSRPTWATSTPFHTPRRSADDELARYFHSVGVEIIEAHREGREAAATRVDTPRHFPSLATALREVLENLRPTVDTPPRDAEHELSPTLRTEAEGMALMFILIMRCLYILTTAMKRTQQYRLLLLRESDPTATEPPFPKVTAAHVRKVLQTVDEGALCVLSMGAVTPAKMYTFLRSNGRLDVRLTGVDRYLNFGQRQEIYLREWERFIANAIRHFLDPGQPLECYTCAQSDPAYAIMEFTDAIANYLLEDPEQYVPDVKVPPIPVPKPPVDATTTETPQSAPLNKSSHANEGGERPSLRVSLPLDRVTVSLPTVRREH